MPFFYALCLSAVILALYQESEFAGRSPKLAENFAVLHIAVASVATCLSGVGCVAGDACL